MKKEKIKTYFNWSSGKDSALALYKLQQNKSYNVDLLLTSINAHYDRVSMHGLRRSMLEAQIRSIGLPFSTIELPEQPSMEAYEKILNNKVTELKSTGYTTAGFGDIFLEDLRKYREIQLAKLNIKTVFPLWKQDTTAILHEFIDLGFKTIVVCIKSDLLDKSFVGRIIDQQFIKDLPPNVDPCGENGEFHTFCYDGPIFKHPIHFEIGEKTFKTYDNPSDDNKDKNSIGFWFCDLIPK